MARLYADEDIASKVVSGLRYRGHDIQSTTQLHRERATDGDQILYATSRGRIFLTHNRNDFFLLRDAWVRWSAALGGWQAHGSILVLDRADIKTLVPIIDAFLSANPHLATGGSLCWWHRDTATWELVP